MFFLYPYPYPLYRMFLMIDEALSNNSSVQSTTPQIDDVWIGSSISGGQSGMTNMGIPAES